MARPKISCLLTSWSIIVLCCLSRTGTSEEDYTQCGIRSVSSRAKVVRGSRSYPGQWPWQVSIYKTSNTDGSGTKQFHCGGALIDTSWVLTAAHCFYNDKNPKRYIIRAGDHNIFVKDLTEQERLVTEIFLFPRYRHFPYYASDLALVKLSRDVVLTPYVRTVCLPEGNGTGSSTAGVVVHAAGWGRTSEKGNVSSILLYSDYQIQNNDLCQRATRYHFNKTVMFCAGDGRGISDTCSGDSGGSLVRQVLHKGAQRWVTVGLVSWGEGCARVGKYGYNTKLEPFLDWIRKIIVQCQDPGSPQHGARNLNKRKYRYKDKVFFSCKTNYTRIGASSIICQDNGKWSGHQALCLAPCEDPGIPKGGFRLDHDFTHGKTVRFRCKKGNLLPSALLISCTNGRWDNNIPNCIAKCPDPGFPRNGVPSNNKSKYEYRDEVIFKCKANYTRIGPSSIVCQRGGTWSGHHPVCLAPCKDPGIPKGGIRLDHNFTHGQAVRFKCIKGNQMQQTLPFITCSNGRWDRSIPSCNNCGLAAIGMENKTIPDSNIRASSVRDQYHTAKEGRLNGPRAWCSRKEREPYLEIDLGILYKITCLATQGNILNSKWVVAYTLRFYSGGSFIKYKEHNIEKLFTGNKDAQSIVVNHLKELLIARKIRIYPMMVSGCDANPACMRVEIYGKIPAPCKDPGIPVGGDRLQHSFLHNSIVQFRCKRGWSMEGPNTIRCNNGKWDYGAPTCSDCGSPLGMESGKIPDANIQASSTRWRYHAKHGRLNGRYAWCSGTARDPYLQIDFGKPYRVTGLATQGSAHDNKWVEQYTVTSNLAGSSFNMYRENNRDKIFIGNMDTQSVKKTKLVNPVLVRKLRIYPRKQGGFSSINPACMRVEVYGCDLPSDCVMVGSRVVAKWSGYGRGVSKKYIYYKAYLTSISTRYWKVELENSNHVSPSHKYFLKYEDLPFVLDVPPKNEELQVGTRVLVPWEYRYYTGTIKTGRGRNVGYRVRADDGDVKDFTIDQIRLLKAPTFCN